MLSTIFRVLKKVLVAGAAWLITLLAVLFVGSSLGLADAGEALSAAYSLSAVFVPIVVAIMLVLPKRKKPTPNAETAGAEPAASQAQDSVSNTPDPASSSDFAFLPLPEVPNRTIPEVNSPLAYTDKERIAVQRVTVNDMLLFPDIPYAWDSNIEKHLAPRSHPFAYMNLTRKNIDIAKAELSKINAILAKLHKQNRSVPPLNIPASTIRFSPSEHYGYTRLICTPKTYTGELSKYPASLCFMTDLESEKNATSGDLFYLQSGKIGKAEINLWRGQKGYFIHFETIDDELIVSKIDLTSFSNKKMEKETIYKADHILAAEAAYRQIELDYLWLHEAFPDKCPKTLTGYRRMKTQNTKNYQTLKQLAAERGRNI